MKSRFGCVGRKWSVSAFCVRMTIFVLVSSFVGIARADLIRVQFLNGRTGKPIAQGRRIWVYFNNRAGRQIVDLHTDSQGTVQFESDGAKTFQANPVGYLSCGEQPVGSSPRDYPIDEVLKTGLLTRNDCGNLNTEPLRGRLVYFVKPASGWQLFRN